MILKEDVKLPEVRPIISAEDYEKLGAKVDSQISEEAVALMIKMMTKNPNERLTVD